MNCLCWMHLKKQKMGEAEAEGEDDRLLCRDAHRESVFFHILVHMKQATAAEVKKCLMVCLKCPSCVMREWIRIRLRGKCVCSGGCSMGVVCCMGSHTMTGAVSMAQG